MGQLRKMVELLAGGRRLRNELSAGEKRLIASYRVEATRLQQQAVATFNPAETGTESPRALWFFKEGDYERDAGIRSALLNKYFSEKFRQFYASIAQSDADMLEQSHIGERAALAGRGLSQWQRLSPQQRRADTRFFLEIGAILALFLIRESRRFGVREGEPPTIVAGFRRYQLTMRAGVVANYQRWVETTTTITERINHLGHVLSRSESSSSSVHESFDIVGADGSTPVHVVGAGLNASNGDAVSGLSAARRLRKQGQWVLFRNHTQGIRVTPLASALGSMLSMSPWVFIPVLLLAARIGADTDILMGLAPSAAPGLRGFVAAFLTLPLLLIVYAVVGSVRVSRFRKRDVPKLLPLLQAPGA